MRIRTGIILMIIVTGALACWIGYKYIYNKPHRDVAAEAPVLVVKAAELYAAYTMDEKGADSMYLNKVLQVEGTIGNININDKSTGIVVLEGSGAFGISCTMAEGEKQKLGSYTAGSQIKLKGLCNGLLMDVILVKCTLVE